MSDVGASLQRPANSNAGLGGEPLRTLMRRRHSVRLHAKATRNSLIWASVRRSDAGVATVCSSSAALFLLDADDAANSPTTFMSPLPTLPLAKAAIPLTFHWPVKFCLSTTAATYFLSLLTGNVSQVDRLWTFLPVIYTAYYALLPFWPAVPPIPLFPYAPEGLHRSLVNEGNPRTALMFTLQVRVRSSTSI